GTKSYDCRVPVNYIFHKELQIIGSNSATKHDLEVMMPLLGSGKLKTVIDRIFPLREAADAHRDLESAKQFGKVILRVALGAARASRAALAVDAPPHGLCHAGCDRPRAAP